jgi:hypothetical protein
MNLRFGDILLSGIPTKGTAKVNSGDLMIGI